MRELLLYLAGRCLSDPAAEITEREIGCAVFGRDPDYESSSDNIVRVEIRQLRSKLRDYFETEGQDEKWILEIPKGGYLPRFVEREEPLALQPGVVSLQGQAPARRWPAVLAASAVILLALSLYWAQFRAARAPAPPPDTIISKIFDGAAGGIQLVVSDDALVLMQALLGRTFSLREYEDLSYLTPPALIGQRGLPEFWIHLRSRQITNLGDLQNTARISAYLRARGWNVTIRHARHMNTRDFKAGNFILFGGPLSNPWGTLFEDPRWDFGLGESRVVNRHPRPGEPAVFATTKGQAGQKDVNYARITLVPNLTHSGRVLLLAGMSMPATEQAGELLLRPDALPKLQQLLGAGASAPLPDMQVVIRTTEMNEIGDSAELAACRRLGPAAPRQP